MSSRPDHSAKCRHDPPGYFGVLCISSGRSVCAHSDKTVGVSRSVTLHRRRQHRCDRCLELDQLIDAGKYMEFRKGSSVFEEGSVKGFMGMYIVYHGTARAYRRRPTEGALDIEGGLPDLASAGVSAQRWGRETAR